MMKQISYTTLQKKYGGKWVALTKDESRVLAAKKTVDEQTLTEVVKKCGAVVTVEEHQTMGGAGSAVAEVLAKTHPVPIEFVGMPNTFGESGKPDELLEKYGMSVIAIKNAVKKVLKRK